MEEKKSKIGKLPHVQSGSMAEKVLESILSGKSTVNEARASFGLKPMLQHAIDIGDKQEIAFLRSEIQHVKAEKRNIKRMMKNRMEPALT